MNYPVINVGGPSSYSFPQGIRVATTAADGADVAMSSIQGTLAATAGLAGKAVLSLQAALRTLEAEYRNLASEHREMVACLESVLSSWGVFASSYGQAVATYYAGIRIAGAEPFSNLLRPADLPYCEGQSGPPYFPTPASGRLTYRINLNGSAERKVVVSPDAATRQRQAAAEARCRRQLAASITAAHSTWKAEVKAAARRMSDLEGRVATRVVGSGGPGAYDYSNAAAVVLSADSYALWAKRTGGHEEDYEDSKEAEVGLDKNLDAMDEETMALIQASPQAMEAFALAWPHGSVPQPGDSPAQTLFRTQLVACGLNSDDRQAFYNSISVDVQNHLNAKATGADLVWNSAVLYSGYDLILFDDDPDARYAFQNGLSQIARVPAMSDWLRGFGVHLGEQIGTKVDALPPASPGEESQLEAYVRRFMEGGSIDQFTDVPFYSEVAAYLLLMSMTQTNLSKQFSVPVANAINEIENLVGDWAGGSAEDAYISISLADAAEEVPGLDLVVGALVDLKESSDEAKVRLEQAEDQWDSEAFLKAQLNLAIASVEAGWLNWGVSVPNGELDEAAYIAAILYHLTGISTDAWSR
jgi:hypothetical protein